MAGTVSPKSEAVSHSVRMRRTARGPAITVWLEAVVEVILNPDGGLWIDRGFLPTTSSPTRASRSATMPATAIRKVGKIQLGVDISSVIRASNDSFRVAWIERRYENASLAVTGRWTAILTVVFDTRTI
jgi:hypothetical protein